MTTLKKVADAICKADGNNPDYVSWVDYKDHAKAALEAMLVHSPLESADVTWNRRINSIIYGGKP